MLEVQYSDVVPMMKETAAMQLDIRSRDIALVEALPSGYTHATDRIRRIQGDVERAC